MRRDAYGSRVLVPRSQCADDAEEDDFEDDDAAYDNFQENLKKEIAKIGK